MGYYMRGDYYRGDYYRGDVWGAIKGAAIGFVTGGPVGAIVGGVAGATGRPAPKVPQFGPTLPQAPVYPPSGLPVVGGLVDIGRKMLGQQVGPTHDGCAPRGYHWNKSNQYCGGQITSPKGTKLVRNRRMNVTNSRALARAARRAHGFINLSRKLVRYYQPHAHKGRAYIGRRKRSR
jgi:hypothetical protein